jgi:hypothetical protein
LMSFSPLAPAVLSTRILALVHAMVRRMVGVLYSFWGA